jgi:hypothetical protein
VETPTLNALTSTSAWVYNLLVAQEAIENLDRCSQAVHCKQAEKLRAAAMIGLVLQCRLFGFTRFSNHGS